MKDEAKKIQDYLEINCSNNPVEVKQRISDLQVYMARSGEMLANAKTTLRRKKASEISETILKIAKENCLSAKAQNVLVDSIAEEDAYLVDWLDRINRSCTHQIDALRSVLSYAKEEMRLNNTGY